MIHKTNQEKSKLERVFIGDDDFYRITNVDSMRPFFMSIVSDSDHWLYISSNGGLTAGRRNAEHALFPYYSDDKITESVEFTGSKSIFRIEGVGDPLLWEPFSYRTIGRYKTERNLYKSVLGNKVLFEEVNHDLQLIFRYEWNSSNKYGFVRKASLQSERNTEVLVSALDGIQNILPCGVESKLQRSASNLVDAYKRSELIEKSGVGVFALSAIITDRAEPSEALKANIAWSTGIPDPTHLLSSLQISNFRNGESLYQESDIRAEKGAYFITAELILQPKAKKEWMIVANTDQNHSAIVSISRSLSDAEDLKCKVDEDIDLGTQRLLQLIAASDGLQKTSDHLKDARHYSNVLFNIMRGGVFDDNYQIDKEDFSRYLNRANNVVFNGAKSILDNLPGQFSLFDLKAIAYPNQDKDFTRLSMEYLPLKFSRRHGDPTRPWNKFSINTRNELDGSKVLDYEGNWRDIFQNWEALVHSYPEFIEGMIFKFLNATTFDGYNPYRVTKGGFDYETIEPENPWSYIGYWGDHQIIYLLKFLEFMESHFPGKIQDYFSWNVFVYANVPYKIKSYQSCIKNAKDTIEFDFEHDQKIIMRQSQIGADGALLTDESKVIYKVNFIEKLLATVTAKLSNFVPEGGIWMNTQRPEWNDANNALVGNGISMVTLYYLRRFLKVFQDILSQSQEEGFKVSNELVDCYKRIRETFESHHHLLQGKISNVERRTIMDKLGQASSDYRLHIYKHGFWGKKRTVSCKGLLYFVKLSLDFIEHSIHANSRQDNLYHSYNLISVGDNDISLSHLVEMLEGQVAVLSSGHLSPGDVMSLLDGLRDSELYRADQASYLLYPNKAVPRFLEKNVIAVDAVRRSALLTELLKKDNKEIIEKDINGDHHFNGNFKNANDLEKALAGLESAKYKDLIVEERKIILQIFEDSFDHKSYTGRSGTFFGYEGLGSIYWHMVSKLRLAVAENYLKAIDQKEEPGVVDRLMWHYYEINRGIGVHKSPSHYGAFPTDPYSHTPAGKGAQQPGMTGQVKEDILCRYREFGVCVKKGRLHFEPNLLRKDEFLTEETVFKYLDINNEWKHIVLEQGSLSFTYCQVPVIYKLAERVSLLVVKKDNSTVRFEASNLDSTSSGKIFRRTGDVIQIWAHLNVNELNLN